MHILFAAIAPFVNNTFKSKKANAKVIRRPIQTGVILPPFFFAGE